LGGAGAAYYVYDATGQRVRKVWQKAPGLTEERIYLGGFEIFRTRRGAIGADTVTLERETLHLMDDKQRIALVETRTLPTIPDPKTHAYSSATSLATTSIRLAWNWMSRRRSFPTRNTRPTAAQLIRQRSQTETAKRYRYTGRSGTRKAALLSRGEA
jgi:hypothetical protein